MQPTARLIQVPTFSDTDPFGMTGYRLVRGGPLGQLQVSVISGGSSGLPFSEYGINTLVTSGGSPSSPANQLGLVTASFPLLINPSTNEYYVPREFTNVDAFASPTHGIALSAAQLQAFNGTTVDRIRTNSAATLASTTQPFAALSAQPGEWSINHTPAANTQATITRAAGAAGVRHVCRSITATLIGLAASAEATVLVNLRDGATGAGTILWSARLLVAGTTGNEVGIAIAGLNIVGSAATAMTLEFAGAGGASTFETVALTGYDTI